MTGLLLSGIPELFLLSLAFMAGDGGRYGAILLAALVHELGHVAVAKLLGARIRLCRTGISGVSLRYDFSLISPAREAVICLAGPLTGVVILLCAYRSGSMSYFAGASAALAVLNLLPISYLDGGCALSAMLSVILPPDAVWQICRALSVTFTLGLWCAAVVMMLRAGGDISVMAAAVYLLYRLFSEG